MVRFGAIVFQSSAYIIFSAAEIVKYALYCGIVTKMILCLQKKIFALTSDQFLQYNKQKRIENSKEVPCHERAKNNKSITGLPGGNHADADRRQVEGC